MSSTNLDEDHSLLRYVPWTKLRKAEDGETVVGLLGIAFELRHDEDYLSVTWVEHSKHDPAKGSLLHQAVLTFRASNMTPSAKSGFARGKIREIKTACEAFRPKVRFLHEAEKDNAAHAAIRHWPQDELLHEYMATEHWADWSRNRDFADTLPTPAGDDATPA